MAPLTRTQWFRVLASALVLGATAGAAFAGARRVPTEVATIGAALAVSSPGDTVLVAPGTYAERIVLVSRVTLRAEAGPGSAVIDAQLGGAAIQAQGLAPPTRLEGFRLTGGRGTDDSGTTTGGDLTITGGSLEVSDCAFDGAQATFGGGTGASGATVTFRRCTWTGTAAGFGGGHFQSGGAVTIEDGTFQTTSAGDGGALYVTGGARLTVQRCVMTAPSAQGDGGGIRLDACVATLSDLRVDGANAGGRGGAIAIAAGGQVIASFCVLVECASGLGGGGFHVSCDAASPVPPSPHAPAARARGGLVQADCALLSMTNCDLLLSRGAAPAAGAVTGAGVVRLASSIVAGNASGLACLDPRATLDVTCTDLYRNGGVDLAGSCLPAMAPSNRAVDPRLCSLAGRDFGLCSNSELISPGCGQPYWGASGPSCGACGPTPARPLTWGGLKALYRD